MILFTPMWDHEVERLGLKRCSATAYALLALSNYATLLALVLALAGWLFFSWPWLWPVWLCWLLGRLLMLAGYRLLARSHFNYDAATITASWQNQDGQPRQYTATDFQRDNGRSDS